MTSKDNSELPPAATPLHPLLHLIQEKIMLESHTPERSLLDHSETPLRLGTSTSKVPREDRKKLRFLKRTRSDLNGSQSQH